MNIFKVPTKKWRKWSKEARYVFNSVYDQIYNNQTLFTHPQAEYVSDEYWKTTAWNAAWSAADAMMHHEPEEVVTVQKLKRTSLHA